MKHAVLKVSVAGLALVVGALVFFDRQAARQAAEQAAWQKAQADRAAAWERASRRLSRGATPEVVPAPSEADASSASPTPPAPPSKSSPPTEVRAPAATSVAKANAAPKAKPEIQDPLARAALSFVGADPVAEEYWAEAINDPTLSAHERQDLIEDLNEEGFPDPKNLTADDLPLILSRILLIEDYVFDAMDDVNAAAFMEAYKDLVNMYTRLTQR